jgi:hypothetical protein
MVSKHGVPQRLDSFGAASAFTELVQELRQQHDQLDALLTTVAEESQSADPARLQAAWTSFERALSAHLRNEERELLPLLISAHPEEVRSILTEHRRLRELVSELGVQIDLHSVRRAALTRLSRMLHVHAKAEERGLYNWLTPTARPA